MLINLGLEERVVFDHWPTKSLMHVDGAPTSGWLMAVHVSARELAFAAHDCVSRIGSIDHA